MLCKGTDAELERLIEFRRKIYGGNRQEAKDWLCGIVGLNNLFLLAKNPPPGVALTPDAMMGAVPVECGRRHGIWLCCMATDPALQGRGMMTKMLSGCLRAFAASGYDFAVVTPQSNRVARWLEGMGFKGRFPLRVIRKPIEHNIRARAEFDNMTVRRLIDARMRYQPACIAVPERTMNTMISRLYRRGMTIVSNQRGYGLYCQEWNELLFLEIQADNDHSADILLQAAREHTGTEKARLLLAENQTLYLGEGKRSGYGMIRFLNDPFPVTDAYFRMLI